MSRRPGPLSASGRATLRRLREIEAAARAEIENAGLPGNDAAAWEALHELPRPRPGSRKEKQQQRLFDCVAALNSASRAIDALCDGDAEVAAEKSLLADRYWLRYHADMGERQVERGAVRSISSRHLQLRRQHEEWARRDLALQPTMPKPKARAAHIARNDSMRPRPDTVYRAIRRILKNQGRQA